MKTIEIRGMTGILLCLMAVLVVLLLLTWVPGWLMMWLWNGILHSELNAPAITVAQGVLLWVIVALSFILLFRPKIEIQIESQADSAVMNPPSDQTLKPKNTDSIAHPNHSEHWHQWRKRENTPKR